MKPTSNKKAPVAVDVAEVKDQDQEPEITDAEGGTWECDPNLPTSIINGNTVLFLGKGAKEITLRK